jgi:hypothetical protein
VNPTIVAPVVARNGQPSAVTDAQGRLTVAWPAPDGAVHVRRLAGDRWEDLPAIPARLPSATPLRSALALGKGGEPLIAVLDDGGVRVLRWDGARYEELSPSAPPPARITNNIDRSLVCRSATFVNDVSAQNFAVDGDGHPFLSWAEPAGLTMRLVVTRHDGRAWQTSFFSGAAPIDPCMPLFLPAAIALGPKGSATVITSDGGAGASVFRAGDGRIEQLPALGFEGRGRTFPLPRLAVDAGGRPWIAWPMERLDGGQFVQTTEVRRLEGKQWKTLPTPAIDKSSDRVDVLSFTGGERPALALYHEGSPGAHVRVLQWNGDVPALRAGGTDGGVVSPGVRRMEQPLVAVPPADGPVAVVFRMAGLEDGSLHVRRFLDGAYRAPGAADGPPARLGEVKPADRSPRIAMRAGRVAVAFWSGDRVTVRRHDGCAWESLPDITDPEGAYPYLAIDGHGRPLVAWAGREAVVVRRYADGAWEDLHAKVDGPPKQLGLVSLIVDAADAPVIGTYDWQRGLFRVMRQDGDTWKPLLEEDVDEASMLPVLSRDAAGALLLATVSKNKQKEISLHVRRRVGERWEELRPWTAPAQTPILVNMRMADDAEPLLAFQAYEQKAPWVLQWNGSSWEELSAPGLAGAPRGKLGGIAIDATGAPIVAFANPLTGEIETQRYVTGWSPWAGPSVSASEAPSLWPSMAVSGDALCVTWTEPTGGSANVLLRCHRR